MGQAGPEHGLRETDRRCHFPGEHPSPQAPQVKQQGEQRGERGDPFPKAWAGPVLPVEMKKPGWQGKGG